LWIGLALVAVAAGTTPWWVPAVVARVAAGYGVAIGSWQTLGWSGAEYRNIRFARDGVELAVDKVRAPVLLIFPRGTSVGSDTGTLAVGTVDVKVVRGPDRADTTPPLGAAGLLRQVESLWATLATWLPATRIERAAITVDDESFAVESLIWDGASVQATVRVPGRGIEGVASVVRSGAGTFVVHARVPARDAYAELTLGGRAEDGATLGGRVSWRGNAADVAAEFGPTGFVPVAATVSADAAAVPASDLGLAGYSPVTGRVHAHWSRDAYTLSIAARAEPLADSAWPVLAVDVRASGDWERARVESVDVNLPSWRAALSQPIEYVFSRGLSAEPAEFSVEGDLAAVPVLAARGRVTGSARVRATDAGEPEVVFSLQGAGLGWRELESVAIALKGVWRRSELAFESATIDLGGERTEASFALDLDKHEVREARVRGSLPPAAIRAIAPGVAPCERVDFEAVVDGPWSAVRHRGSARFSGLEWTPGRKIGGHAAWSGVGMQAAVEGELALAGGGTLPFVAGGRRGGDDSWSGTIDQLRWVDQEGEWWHLAEPLAVRWEPATRLIEVAPWRMLGDGFEIRGEARVRWPGAGDVSLHISGLDGRRFGGVLPEAIRGSRIESLRARARWDNGPAQLEGSGRATYTPVKGVTYAVEAEFGTQGDDLALGAVRVADASGVVLSGTGRLPLGIVGGDTGFHAGLRRDGALSLELESQPNPVFWKSIADLTGWVIEDPRLKCRLEGTLAAPRGEATLSAGVLRLPVLRRANGGKLPDLTGLLVRLSADDAGLSIIDGMVAIDQRWVTLTGHAPWEVWSRWRETGVVEWRRASFDLASNPLPIASASRVFTTELAPVGEVSIKIAHAPGTGLSGRAWLHGAALRPIGPLGSIRDVNSELDFAGYVLKLNGLEGLLGGQPVRITGEADLTEPDQTAFSLRLTSSRVPLVRRAGLIIRTELDLELRKLPRLPARVTGSVDFGPSLYRADLLQLVPAGVDSPSTRPPYFSIEEKPFADWQLDVAVRGEAFLRLITPFYKDLLSADLRLTGTLAEPRAEGWMWGTGGVVIFPFGSLPVEQVLVTLSRDNPFEPRLLVSGEGRIMGYDIRMEASGPASEPRLLFTSDPPLTSHQVFLMLTTGAVPDEDHTIGASDRASRLAMFLGRNLAAGLGLGGTGTGGDARLSIRSGEDFSREGRETVTVQYDLDGRWSVVGEYDRFDAYNGGIKFRLINR
jgi:translocation and assembly module TamB